jgi:predicted nucleic acid-binding protein
MRFDPVEKTKTNNQFIITAVPDIGCLLELNKINQLDLLRKLYGKVRITPEVAKGYGMKLPGWIKIKNAKNKNLVREINKTLGTGESSSIALSYETPESLLILDGKEGLETAVARLGLICTGTAGVIRQAYMKGYIESRERALEYAAMVTEQYDNNLFIFN